MKKTMYVVEAQYAAKHQEKIISLLNSIEWLENRREMALDCPDSATLYELNDAEVQTMKAIFSLMLDLDIQPEA